LAASLLPIATDRGGKCLDHGGAIQYG